MWQCAACCPAASALLIISCGWINNGNAVAKYESLCNDVMRLAVCTPRCPARMRLKMQPRDAIPVQPPLVIRASFESSKESTHNGADLSGHLAGPALKPLSAWRSPCQFTLPGGHQSTGAAQKASHSALREQTLPDSKEDASRRHGRGPQQHEELLGVEHVPNKSPGAAHDQP